MSKDYQSQELYSKQYSEQWLHKEKEKQAQYLINKLSSFTFIKGKKFLDAGCGVGTLGIFLKRKYNCSVDGIEINKRAVIEAKKNGVNAVIADLEKKWPFKDNSFDVVISVQVIEHLVNPDAFLIEANRVLKKGGLIIVATPNLAAWFNRVIFLFGYQPFFLEVSTIDKTIGLKFTRKLTNNREPLGHVRGFTLFALKEILEMHKFSIVKSIGGEVNYLPNFMRSFDKFFSFFPGLATDLIVIAKKQ